MKNEGSPATTQPPDCNPNKKKGENEIKHNRTERAARRYSSSARRETRLVHGMRVRNRGLCVYIFELGWGGDGSMVVCNFFSLISAAFPCPMSYPEVILSPFPYPSRLWLQQPHGRSS